MNSVLTSLLGLNRTFYGIETRGDKGTNMAKHSLNRTFYGIETNMNSTLTTEKTSLNRTFYGIETSFLVQGS